MEVQVDVVFTKLLVEGEGGGLADEGKEEKGEK